jgi:hypothetical protein
MKQFGVTSTVQGGGKRRAFASAVFNEYLASGWIKKLFAPPENQILKQTTIDSQAFAVDASAELGLRRRGEPLESFFVGATVAAFLPA